MGWVKLARGNDWGAEYLAPEGKVLSNGAADQRLAMKVTTGDRIKVRWPDGTETEAIVSHKTYHTKVPDMGHEYPVSYMLPGIASDLHGVDVWLALDQFAAVWIDDVVTRHAEGLR